MLESRLGELAALATAVCWTVTAMSFEYAGKRVGSLPVNIIRLFFAFFFLGFFSWITRGTFMPMDASAKNWFWLLLSGLIGFSLGDLFLFRAFVIIGSRISMLIMAFVPIITTVLGRLIINEILLLHHYIGMFLTIAGIVLVILEKDANKNNIKFSRPLSGLLFAFGGACGQAVGLVLSKYGMGDYNPFSATQIRVIAGIAGFSVIFTVMRLWPRAAKSFKHPKALSRIALGAFFGPFLGVSFSLLAVQYTATGIASTIMSIVPVLIIPPAVVMFKEKISTKEVIGAVVAVIGVGVLFM